MKKSFVMLAALIGGFLFSSMDAALAQRGSHGGGGYHNNCIIKPTFEKPAFDRSTYERTEIVRSRAERFEMVRSTIERTQMVRSVYERPQFIRPTFDSCKGQSDSGKVLPRRTLPSPTASTTTTPALAHHGLLDRGPAPSLAQVADSVDCCGGGGVRNQAVR